MNFFGPVHTECVKTIEAAFGNVFKKAQGKVHGTQCCKRNAITTMTESLEKGKQYAMISI